MVAKAIVDVEVQGDKFAAFQKMFDQYQKALAKMPGDWKKMSDQQRVLNSQFQRATESLLKQKEIAEDTDDADEKRVKRLGTSEKLWTSMSRSSTVMAKSVLDVSTGLLKWGTIIGGGLLGGSLLGVDRMAAGVSNSRRSAMGLGVTPGEQKAFDIDFGRLVDPNFLAMVNEMKSDQSKGTALNVLGVGNAGSTAETAIALLDAMRAKAKAAPSNMLGMLDSMNATQFGTEQWRRLQAMGDPEYASLKANYARDAKSFNPGEGEARGWQDFTTQMERAGAQINNVFVKGLAPLAGPLEHLSGAFVKFLGKLTEKNGIVEEGIDKVAGWLEVFSGKLAKPEFLQKVEQFTSDVGGLADIVHTVSEAAQHPGKTLGKVLVGDLTSTQTARWNAAKSIGRGAWDWAEKALAHQHLSFLDKKYGLPAGTLETLGMKESAGELDAPDQPGPNGAGGPFQIKPSMANGINVHSYMQASERAAQILAQELQRYKGDVAKAIAAYNLGDPTLDKTIKQYGSDWRVHVPYLTNVKIENATGGSATVSVNALAAGP